MRQQCIILWDFTVRRSRKFELVFIKQKQPVEQVVAAIWQSIDLVRLFGTWREKRGASCSSWAGLSRLYKSWMKTRNGRMDVCTQKHPWSEWKRNQSTHTLIGTAVYFPDNAGIVWLLYFVLKYFKKENLCSFSACFWLESHLTVPLVWMSRDTVSIL